MELRRAIDTAARLISVAYAIFVEKPEGRKITESGPLWAAYEMDAGMRVCRGAVVDIGRPREKEEFTIIDLMV